MAKKGQKLVEIFLGTSHMIKKTFSTFFVFQRFLLGTLQTLNLG